MTPKQARFVREYLKDLNATQAAIRAGYSQKTAKQIGSHLLTNIDVQAAVEAAQAKIATRLELTAERVLRNLEQARLNAMETLEWGPAIRACELQGKHLGMFTDKVTITDERMVVRAPDKPADAADWAGKHGPH